MMTLLNLSDFSPSLKKGFTLTELMISVVIIGVICAIMIPQIWANSEDIKRQATLRLTLASFENHFMRENMTNQQTNTAAVRWAAMKSGMQYKFACGSGEASAIGVCAGVTPVATASGFGFDLNSGVTVHGLFDNNTGTDLFHLDLNGSQAPNLNCSDRHTFSVNNATGQVGYPNTCTRTLVEGS